MEYEIKIREGERESTLPKTPRILIQDIDDKVRCLPHSIPEPCIFKVNGGLRKSNPEAYTPMLVSIGPYHRGNPNSRTMQEHKLWYLHSFLERKKEESVEKYILAMEKIEDRARKCYAYVVDLESDEFLEMMLLDGCFIVEFVRRVSELGPDDKDDPIFRVDWMKVQISRDLMLLENQLPYFVLSKLYDMTEDPTVKEPFTNMAMLVFSGMFPKLCPASIFSCENEAQEIKHLLHLVHVLCRPPFSRTCLEGNTMFGSELFDQMHSVIELQEAGVKFKKVGKVYAGVESLDSESLSDSVRLFDIRFNKGLMEIPCFKVEDSTETFLRNLIAYEQHCSDVNPKYFTDYATFMDQLINSDQDVNVLRRNGVIVNMLGDDDEVAQLFNKLGEGVITSSSFSYSGVCNKVNQHCGQIWNVVMTRLRHDYFHSPWAAVSTIAAVVLLLLTVVQTVASLIPLFA